MRVRMNVSITGTRNGEDWPSRGGEVDLPDAEAVDLLNAGLASPVAESKPEKADAGEARVEKAVSSTASRKPRKS